MSRFVYQMKVEKILDRTPNVRELDLRLVNSESFNFRAGQFAMLHVPADPKPALRAYSIASHEGVKNGFKLLFKFVPNGVASTYVWDLKGGEILNFTGPFGKVFFQEPPSEQVIFLNTGTGISQHYSYLVSNKSKYPHVKYRMLFGVRNESEIYYEKQLLDLSNELPDFQYDYVLSRPSEKWNGKKGYIQHFLNERPYLGTGTSFYLCGNGGMIKEVKAKLQAENFDMTKVHSEAFD